MSIDVIVHDQIEPLQHEVNVFENDTDSPLHQIRCKMIYYSIDFDFFIMINIFQFNYSSDGINLI